MKRGLASILLFFFIQIQPVIAARPLSNKVQRVLKSHILKQANWALAQEPLTITSFRSNRSAGGIHDFFSEGDYWWPNPENLNGPYIQKDGFTNPDNFTQHRKAMIRFSQVVGALTSAYLLTKEPRYLDHALNHLKAWFIDTATLMNPSLLYAQAIKGKVTGRSIGIIDMIQLIEVAQAVRVMEKYSLLAKENLSPIKNWFTRYLEWVTSHPYGIEERDTKNNHATCWVMQVAVFAKLVNNESIAAECRNRFKNILLPFQMDKDGSFPLELKRSKPFGYSLFNLDAMATIAQTLSQPGDDLWNYSLSDGRSLKKGIDFLFPYVLNKQKWPYSPDVMYWEEWPIAQPFLLFGFLNYNNPLWYKVWKKLDHDPTVDEIVRNFPIRNPLLWIEKI